MASAEEGTRARDTLLARAHIADLVNGYANAVCVGDVDGCVALFAPDAEFEVRLAAPASLAESRVQSSVAGQDSIRTFLTRSVHSDGATVLPTIHNLVITVDGDRATSRCLMVGIDPKGTTAFTGFYDDAYRCEGSWAFARRCFTITGWNEI